MADGYAMLRAGGSSALDSSTDTYSEDFIGKETGWVVTGVWAGLDLCRVSRQKRVLERRH